jgi:hypothetical protein
VKGFLGSGALALIAITAAPDFVRAGDTAPVRVLADGVRTPGHVVPNFSVMAILYLARSYHRSLVNITPEGRTLRAFWQHKDGEGCWYQDAFGNVIVETHDGQLQFMGSLRDQRTPWVKAKMLADKSIVVEDDAE